VDAAFMLLAVHGWDIHVVCRAAADGCETFRWSRE
jgi:hypothetical protein